jgi:hypothetical protein
MQRQKRHTDQNNGARRRKGASAMATTALDPHLVALAKYLARRAAERDYRRLTGTNLDPDES